MQGSEGSGDEKPSTPPAPTPSLRVVKLQFRGNRKVEDDAIKINLKTAVGVTLTQEMLREDVRAIWKMGYFDDAQVEVTEGKDGSVVTFVLREKPAIKKIYVAGNDEVALSKINEVLDIKKEQILDLAKLKKNVEKIKDLYVEKGFYMAEVTYEVKRDTSSTVDVWFHVSEHAKVEVRRVNFVGNTAIPDAQLRDVISTHEGNILSFMTSAGTYREDVFQRDLLLIQAHYWDRGYVQVKVGNPLVELSPDKQSMYITISVEEGPQYRLGKVDVTGELLAPREYFLQRVSVKSGEIFNRSKLSDDLQKLTDYYKDRGYAYVNATPSTPVNEKTRTVDVAFEIQKGPLVTFDRIRIRGNTKTRDKVIRRELRIFEGDTYNQTQLDYSKRRVTALGFFEKADVSTKRGSSDDKMDVNFEVAERPTGTFQIGAGFSSVENFIAQAQISQNNLLGRGQLLTLQAQLSSLRQLFLLQFQDLYFLDTKWTFGFNLFKQDQFLFSFVRSSKGGSLTWGYLIAEDTRLLLTYTLEDVSVSTSGFTGLFSSAALQPTPIGSIANLLRSGITSSGRALLSYDSRDNRMFPTKGWYNTISGEIADTFLLSENVFTRYEAVARAFYPIWGPFVLRLKANAGLIASRDAARRADLRALLRGRHLRRARVPAALAGSGHPRAQRPRPGLDAAQLPGRRQHERHHERGGRVPDLRQGRHPRRRVHGHGERVQSGRSVLRDPPVNVDDSKNPCLGPAQLVGVSSELGLRVPLVLAHRARCASSGAFLSRPCPGEQPIVFEFTIGNFF